MQRTMKKYWSPDDSICDLCGQAFTEELPAQEMFHQDTVDEEGSLITHEYCGKRCKMEYA